MDNLIKLNGEGGIKTQTITQTVSISKNGTSTVTFTFTNLKEVYGIKQINKTAATGTTGMFQQIGQQYAIPVSYINEISGNAVKLVIVNVSDTTSVANWAVTAVGR